MSLRQQGCLSVNYPRQREATTALAAVKDLLREKTTKQQTLREDCTPQDMMFVMLR